MTPRPIRRVAAVAVGTVAAVGCLAWPSTTAVAAPLPSAGVACSTSTQATVPVGRRDDDTMPVTRADLDALPTDTGASPGTLTRELRASVTTLPAAVTVPVYVHVVKGTRRGERSPSGPDRVRRIIAILNGGFHGEQSPDGAAARYTFVLKRIDYTTREGWYHAFLLGPRDKRMKRALHRGGRGDLNLYINGGGPAGEPILGWTTFPWRQHSHPRLDSVTVNWKAMPGGPIKHYNLGDTVVHETGHWFGLFHTFQGGCIPPGDEVADTPYEAQPSYYCQTTSDTCTAPGTDPVHDFMDYSYDSCMNQFTAGQVARMDAVYAKYRE
jgi:hypothetical protein